MVSEQQKLSMPEILLEQEQPLIQPGPEGHEHDGAGPSPLTTILGFVFLSFSSAMAVSSWHRGYGAVSFVVFSYLDLAMLFYCLRQYERTPLWSPRRELLKMTMWLLGTMHVLSFFELLEFCFQTSIGATENSIMDFQSNTTSTCPHQHPMLPDGGC